METLSNIVKRKKRKTRKCLDEMRKRSRHNTNLNESFNKGAVSKLVVTVSNINGGKPVNNYITSNRLTLAMLPKAVQSETITRPALSKLRYDSHFKLHNVINGKKNSNTETSGSIKISKPINNDNNIVRLLNDESICRTVFEKCQRTECNKEQLTFCRENDYENMSKCDPNTRSSFNLLSPFNPSTDTDVFEVSPNEETVSTLTTASSQSSLEGFAYHLYGEFMNEIPSYLKENISALIKEDVMKKTKMYLQNIYIDNCRRQCESNLLQCIKNNALSSNSPSIVSTESVVQNPMEYIKLGYALRRGVPHKFNGTVPCSSVSSRSLLASCSLFTTCSPPRSIIQDTPEYIYYPHKLN